MSHKTDRSPALINDPRRLPRLISVVTIGAALLGFGVGLLALGASLGVWLGIWDFRQGFSVLQFANTHARWITVLAIGLAFLLWASRRLPAARHSANAGSLVMVAAFVALLAWQVPESYRPPQGTPPIHDITTDLDDPPAFVAVLPLRGSNSNPVEYGTAANMTPERQAELQRQAYPEIQPVLLGDSPDRAFQRALAAVEQLGWELVAQVPEEGRIEATDTTFWFRFKDDVVIRIRAEGDGSRIDARSTSRVGVSDVGKNAARLREFFAAL